MKAFTNIEQSKKLAELLPIESADGFYESQYSSSTDTWETLLFTGNEWASPEVVIPDYTGEFNYVVENKSAHIVGDSFYTTQSGL